jgi:phage terminase large subunit-like protein
MVTHWAKRRLGIEHGPWQAYALGRILECDADGIPLARTALVSVGRQNGKSIIVRSLIGWILDEGHKLEPFALWDLVLLAAHDAKQARVIYDYVRRDTESYARISGWGHTARIQGKGRARATLYGGIELNGIMVDVASRQAGSQRGRSIGLNCFDEVLTQTSFEMYDVLSPAMSAIPNSLMLLTSTAGFSDSVVLLKFYEDLERIATGAQKSDGSFCGVWWRADEDDVGLDWEQIKKANPALDDGRLSRQMIEREYRILPRGSWVRERLNRWHDERVDAPFSLAQWGACRVPEPLNPETVGGEAQYTIGVDVTSSWSEGSIIVAAQRLDGTVGVETHRYLRQRPDVPLVAEDFTTEVVKLAKRLRVENVVYAAQSPLAPALERMAVIHSIPILPLSYSRNMLACSDFAEAVVAKRVAVDDAHLDAQVGSAQRRFVGTDGQWRWAISAAAITSVIAMTFAVSLAARAEAPVQVFL